MNIVTTSAFALEPSDTVTVGGDVTGSITTSQATPTAGTAPTMATAGSMAAGVVQTGSASVGSFATGAIDGPQALPATWFAAVERRILDSIVPNNKLRENDGRWLDADVARAALRFLREASEMIPVEPHIYRSNSGDLVAEFATKSALLTGVISTEQFFAVTSLQGVPQQLTINLAEKFTVDTRRLLREMTEPLKK